MRGCVTVAGNAGLHMTSVAYITTPTLAIRTQHIRLCLSRRSQDHFPPLLRTGFDVHFERETLIQKPVRVSLRGGNVDRDGISGDTYLMLNAKAPKQLRDGNEERSLRQVDAWADATAHPVSPVVALCMVPCVGIHRCKLCLAGIPRRVEVVGLGVAFGIVMDAPDVQHDSRAHGDAYPGYPFVCPQAQIGLVCTFSKGLR